MIKELQSLCLDIKVLNEDMKEIEIKDSDDDINDTARELEIDIGTRPEKAEEMEGALGFLTTDVSGEPVDEEPEEIEAEEIEPDDEDLMDWIVQDP